jgi:hypothetical protein
LPATTARYAHLAANPVRRAGETIANRLLLELQGRQATVHELARRPLATTLSALRNGRWVLPWELSSSAAAIVGIRHWHLHTRLSGGAFPVRSAAVEAKSSGGSSAPTR